jgi:pimeloyl-ACP methyl ester carboxylesterase
MEDKDAGNPMPKIKAGMFELDYAEAGAGPAIVLVHSSASGNRQWRKLMEAMQGSHRLIAVNLFGYGETSKWPGERPLTVADEAALVEAAAGLDPGPVTLIGHSLGGAVSLEAALRLGNKLKTLIIFEPILFHLLRAQGETAAADEIEALGTGFGGCALRDDWDAAGEVFIDYWSGAGFWRAMPEERRTAIQPMLVPVVDEWDMIRTTTRDITDWSAIKAPVHLVSAADSKQTTRKVAALLAKANPHWIFHELSSGGHMAPVANANTFNGLVQKILLES